MANEEDDNFDKIFARELINYGGFHPTIAKKTHEKEGEKIEKKTEHLAQLIKQAKEGLIDLEEEEESSQANSSPLKQLTSLGPIESLSMSAEALEQLSNPAEERSESLFYLK
jgi:hypothetical protein